MFDLFASTLSAVSQLATFAVALVCWGLGALLVGNAVYWRMHAVRVEGEVIGVRRNGNCLNSVYRYDLPSGESCEATSLEGSSSARGRETGTRVPLWVMPEKPHEVQERDNHVFTVIGVVFLGAGLALLFVGIRSWRGGATTWVIASIFVAHMLQKVWSILSPKDKSLPRLGVRQLLNWRELLARQMVARVQAAQAQQAGMSRRTQAAAPMQRIEELTSLPEYREKVSRQRANLRRFAPFLLLAGTGLLALGVHQSRALLRLEASGVRVPGTVTSLVSSTSNSGEITYYPRVTYTDGAGRRVVFKDSTGTNPPLYRIGESVTVLYLPADAARAIIDRGAWNWLPSALLYVLGGALFAVGLAGLRTRSAADADPLAPGAIP
jgi:Protein of unknown function (DUF3592)